MIKAITQSIIKYYNSIPRINPENLKVLLCAPTGKAAFNINGITLHAAFVLPFNQSKREMPRLSASVCNTLFARLKDLELIIIDEVSILGSYTFALINERLQQIFTSKEMFGGKSIILFGDFYQLPPVGDQFIFMEK